MFKKILCATDGSPTALKAAKMAAGLASVHGASLTLINVAPLKVLDLMGPRGSLGPEGLLPRQVEEHLEKVSQESLKSTVDSLEGQVQVETTNILGHPGDEICHAAKEGGYDLVVMGSRGQSTIERVVLGSVSDYVVHHCTCPVLVIR